jgi:hypothetical protein
MNWGTQLRRVVALIGVTVCATSGGVLAFGATAASAAPTVRTCGSGPNAYTVTVPSPTTSTTGADPQEIAAANCTIGYHEKKGYPFSIIGLMLVVTVATLALLHWKKNALDLGWSEDDPQMGGDALPTARPAGGEL